MKLPSLRGVLILCFVCYKGSAFNTLLEGENTCMKTRLVKVLDVFSNNPLSSWPCEDYFSSFTCSQISSGEVPISEVYYPVEERVCCPGSYQDDSGQCQSPCPLGLYGQGCMVTCSCLHASDYCNHVDGSCDCNEGWTGRDCDERCSPGTYGRNCAETTPTCMNGGTNHPSTGVCLCPVTFQGSYCEEACPSQSCMVYCMNCYPDNTHTCDHVITVCRCKSGWQGFFCTEPCASGYKGEFCHEKACSGNGIYVEETKGCKCNDGYHGDDCEEQCAGNTYGPRCTLTCDCDQCDHVTGACMSCPMGFTGYSCTTKCPESTWGERCNRTCECEDCNVFMGTCQKLPQQKVPKAAGSSNDNKPKLAITGGLTVAGGVVLLLMVALILFVSTKCLSRKRNPEMESEAFPALSSVRPEARAMADRGDDYKEDSNSLYQEIDDNPSRYTKPDLPSAPPGTPLDLPKYERVLNNYDPHYLIPDVK